MAVNILLSVVAGIVLQATFSISLLIYVLFAVVAIGLSFWERRFLYMLFVVLSAVNLALQVPGKMEYGARDLTFSGIVVGEDQYEHFAKLRIHIDNVCSSRDTIDHRCPVDYYTFKRDVFLGKRLTIKGRIRPSRYAHRPNMLSGTVVSTSVPKHVLGTVFQPVRNYVDVLLQRSFKNEQYSIASGLTLGGSGRLDKELRDVFSRAGILHILAVSGLHVGFVALFLGLLLLFVPIDGRLKFVLIILGLFVYAGVTGFRPSVCRATLMACLFGLARVLQRNVGHNHILNITAIAFLVASPSLFFDVGAQLSFAAVYGILYLYPKIDVLLSKKVRNHYLKLVLRTMSVSFSAQLFVAPLLVFYFQRVPVYAVLSNLLVVPIAALIIFLLFICFLAGTCCTAIFNVITLPVSMLINVLIMLSRFFAGMPGSSVPVIISPLFIMPLYVLVWRRARRWFAWIMMALLAVHSIAFSVECLNVCVANDGILLTTPYDETVLITGKRTAVLQYFVERQGRKEVDYLVAPERNVAVKKGYVQTPGKLQFRNISLGDLQIRVSNHVSLRFRDVDIECDDESLQLAGEGAVVYMVTNGREKEVLHASANLSIIDRMVLDVRLIIARLRLLL